MIFLSVGEPDFTATQRVREAAERALRDGRTQYTQATGLLELRERLSQWYLERFGLTIPARRIIVTAGASAALELACLALFEAGDEVLMPDPCYPCNRNFVAAVGATAKLLPCGPEQRYQLDAMAVQDAWTERTRGVLLASPSNPTGTSVDPLCMQGIADLVRARGGVCIVDEIYLALSYDSRFVGSALACGEDLISVNSFSKYFGMTGWRLGWLVVPEVLVEPIERLAQNLYICPSSVSQRAAVACFEPESLTEYELRREQFLARRDFVVPALRRLGLAVPVMPDGAFYAYVDCSQHAPDSWDFCFDMMRRAHVALAPGRDFGRHQPERHLRLSFASSMAQLEEAIHRLGRAL